MNMFPAFYIFLHTSLLLPFVIEVGYREATGQAHLHATMRGTPACSVAKDILSAGGQRGPWCLWSTALPQQKVYWGVAPPSSVKSSTYSNIRYCYQKLQGLEKCFLLTGMRERSLFSQQQKHSVKPEGASLLMPEVFHQRRLNNKIDTDNIANIREVGRKYCPENKIFHDSLHLNPKQMAKSAEITFHPRPFLLCPT